MVWLYVALALVVVLAAGFLYDRRRRAVIRGDSASRHRDLGRAVEHDNSGLERRIRGGQGL
ncbi:uncharacterized membrane-anchored protein YhcB (DUF1043 family) [Nocardioides aromaticivorans]|uniref:Uncharacterized membrane-anchored protein YhcB (DUF1043 family) n=1 Tax=Nocardioides aromaticivorans TaxID=200618 RepID=A0A7Z0CPJ9_9ACTN|nr:hypothetical protein [Nocardioides aromaticivorans]NYI46393.1 uncharacterized membrane-anchored protein YhcB (DUF1043 family) [Nocardioides aromaticivorans]QSR25510.1 hypothetical protein CFH99_07720 [Nocardioides aromaticivorans]